MYCVHKTWVHWALGRSLLCLHGDSPRCRDASGTWERRSLKCSPDWKGVREWYICRGLAALSVSRFLFPDFFSLFQSFKASPAGSARFVLVFSCSPSARAVSTLYSSCSYKRTRVDAAISLLAIHVHVHHLTFSFPVYVGFLSVCLVRLESLHEARDECSLANRGVRWRVERKSKVTPTFRQHEKVSKKREQCPSNLHLLFRENSPPLCFLVLVPARSVLKKRRSEYTELLQVGRSSPFSPSSSPFFGVPLAMS